MKSLMTVSRFNFKPDWTISRYYIRGIQRGYGVEDEIRAVKKQGETAVPYGVYPLGYRHSPKFSESFYYDEASNKLIEKRDWLTLSDDKKVLYKAHDLIWVMNIPNFDYVLIHWGNTDDDTDGCYVVGDRLGVFAGQEGVTSSKANYIKLYQEIFPLVKKGGQTIEYTKAA